MSVTAVGNSSSGSTSSTTSAMGNFNLTPTDFIQMMITQLKNQDPTQPQDSSQLLTQLSQIGQLQSSTQMTSTLQSMQLQTQLGSASSLIGKNVTGLDSNGASLSGVVTSVSVSSSAVNLNLDNGSAMNLTNVQTIATPTTATTG